MRRTLSCRAEATLKTAPASTSSRNRKTPILRKRLETPKVFHLVPKGVEKAPLSSETYLFEESTNVECATYGTDEKLQFELKGSEVYVTDLGTPNGTKIIATGKSLKNPTSYKTLDENEPYCIQSGDLIQLTKDGNSTKENTVRLVKSGAVTLKQVKSDIKFKPWVKPRPSSDEVVGEAAKFIAPDFPILKEGESVIVGSDPSCDVEIPLVYVSKKHAKIEKKKDTLFITDLGSTNGTQIRDTVNSPIKVAKSDEELELVRGGYLVFGNSGEFLIYRSVGTEDELVKERTED